MKIYISGKMNGCSNYRDKFNEAENKLREIIKIASQENSDIAKAEKFLTLIRG